MHLRAHCQYMSAKVAGLLKVRSVIRLRSYCEKKKAEIFSCSFSLPELSVQ